MYVLAQLLSFILHCGYSSTSTISYTLEQCIEHLRQQSGVHIPEDDADWGIQTRTDVVIRRTHLVKDAIKEAKKNRFDPSKLISVSISA